MAKRSTISKKTRFEVFKRDSFTCQYCGASAPAVVLQIDHIQPVSKDGDNDILNLITSCFDCNAGKKDRLLSDDSAVQKQKAQLDELNTRREQLEMMLAWRSGLQEIEALELTPVLDACNASTPGFTINPEGVSDLKRLVKKFGVSCVLDSIETSKTYLKRNKKGDLTLESANTAFSKIGGICLMSSQPDWKKELYYIRGIARKRCEHYFNNWKAIDFLEKAYDDGVPLEYLREIAREVTSWTKFVNAIVRARKEFSDG